MAIIGLPRYLNSEKCSLTHLKDMHPEGLHPFAVAPFCDTHFIGDAEPAFADYIDSEGVICKTKQ